MELFEYDTVVYFDTETTGLNYKKDQITELAAFTTYKDADPLKGELDHGGMDEFIRLFAVDKLPYNIVKLTGITDEILATKGMDEKDALKIFFSLWDTDKTLLVAHNAQFDLNFLQNAVERYPDKNWKEKLDACDYLDTLTVYRDISPYPHKLADAIEEYGLTDKVQNSHRAIDDCKALYEVTKKMAGHTDLSKYINLFGIHPKYGISGDKMNHATYINQSLTSFDNNTKLYQQAEKEKKADE